MSKLRDQGRLVLIEVNGGTRVDFEQSDARVSGTADPARAANGVRPQAGAKAGSASPPARQPSAQAGAGANPPADEDFSAARTRREIAEANMAEMRERELAGQLIRVDAVRASGARTVATARDALLQIPHRMTAYLTPEVLQMLEAEIRSVMLELSNLGRTK
ncbi:MAG: hypothetical protein JM57_13930 [Comamonadaceae bacterium BICA1-1]|nr:MAG: hypothetical protein JM57_13930 [Comamonadaceae bacterium BICA1-1]